MGNFWYFLAFLRKDSPPIFCSPPPLSLAFKVNHPFPTYSLFFPSPLSLAIKANHPRIPNFFGPILAKEKIFT
jgi:hypothetical protein